MKNQILIINLLILNYKKYVEKILENITKISNIIYKIIY